MVRKQQLMLELGLYVFLYSLPSDHNLSRTERWRCVLAFTNCDQMFTKNGTSDLHFRTNARFTRCACVKEREKYVVEWWEMCYQWESDIQTYEIRFREIALSYKFVTCARFYCSQQWIFLEKLKTQKLRLTLTHISALTNSRLSEFTTWHPR